MPAAPEPGDWGIVHGFHDIAGSWHPAPAATVAAILSAMGARHRRPPPSPVRALAEGARPQLSRGAEVITEDGAVLRASERLPAGYHTLKTAAGAETLLIVYPRRCAAPPAGLTWAWAAQLYAVRSRSSWGIGDLGDLAELAGWAASTGARGLLVNPLHAPLPVRPQEPSPYYPSSRLYRNPLYIRIESVPGADRLGERLEPLAAAGARLNHRRRIDRDAVFRLKRRALQELWQGFGGSPDFERYLEREGESLMQYATFCAIAERRPAPWKQWPSELRHPSSRAVAGYRAAHAGRVRFHAWLQWLLDWQLSTAARAGAGLVHDLAIGVNPDGADAWLWQDYIAGDMRVGAPPDPFQAAGQDWGLPPFDPWRLREARYAPFIATLRAAFRHGAGLRLDHVMGLFRLFWVPAGGTPADGAYVLYPDRDLVAILALESRRAGAYVVGEDLGTVEDRVRDSLRARGALSYRLMWFEERPPADYPAQALAAVTTHDLPTVAGLWKSDDTDQMRARLIRYTGADAHEAVDEVIRKAYAALAGGRARIVAATVDDALAVVEQPNRPGIVDERNWQLPLPGGLDALRTDWRPRALAAAITRAREASKPGQR